MRFIARLVGRLTYPVRFGARLLTRWKIAFPSQGTRWALVLLGILMVGLTTYGTATVDKGPSNLALNAGVEILTVLIGASIVAPLVQRSQEGAVRSYPWLNYRRFVDQSAGARQQVQVFTTFSTMLNLQVAERFLATSRTLMARDVKIYFLLLHPDSLAAQQRQRELAGADVNAEIHKNIHTLQDFKASVPTEHAGRLLVRLYDASASVIMHRWDDRGLISFLPTDRLAEEGQHLEVGMGTTIGAFVESRFTELWNDPKTISVEAFVSMSLTLVNLGNRTRPISAGYITVGGFRYAYSSHILTIQQLNPERGLRAHSGRDDETVYDLVIVDLASSPLKEDLVEAFDRKYRRRDVDTLFRLHPVESG